MSWDTTVKATDLAIVVATFLGPIAAVQAQAWAERMRDTKRRRENIFFTLMGTRAAPLAVDHVGALNAIPLQFYGVSSVVQAHKDYLRHLNASTQTPDWGQKRLDLLADLLLTIAGKLGYRFTITELRTEVYAPLAHFNVETEQTAIRQGLVKLLSGNATLPLDVKSLPGDPETQAAFKAWLKGESAVQVAEVTQRRE